MRTFYVYLDGIHIGTTRAVSAAKAINNVRFRLFGNTTVRNYRLTAKEIE